MTRLVVADTPMVRNAHPTRAMAGLGVVMPNYRRASVAGATYFFTVVAYRRQPFLCDDVAFGSIKSVMSGISDTM